MRDDKYLEMLDKCITKAEEIIGLDAECEVEDSEEDIQMSEIEIEDLVTLIVLEFRDNYTKEELKGIIGRLTKSLDRLPYLSLMLRYLHLKKLNFSPFPFTSDVSEALVSFTDRYNATEENLKLVKSVKLCLTTAELKDKRCMNSIEYRLLRMFILTVSIGAYIGSCFIADFILRQIITEKGE